LLLIGNQNEKLQGFVKNLLIDINTRSSTANDAAVLKLGLYKESKKRVDDIYESVISRLVICSVLAGTVPDFG
jgi:hypothetical protein